MMKRETFAIADIYVPIKPRTTLEQKRVDEIATSSWTTASKHRSWCGRTARGKSNEATGKFSVRARAATSLTEAGSTRKPWPPETRPVKRSQNGHVREAPKPVSDTDFCQGESVPEV